NSIRKMHSRRCILNARSNMKSSRLTRRGTLWKFLRRNESAMSDMEGPESNEKTFAPAEIDRKRLAAWLRHHRNLRYPLTLALLSTDITFGFGFCAYLVVESMLPPE